MRALASTLTLTVGERADASGLRGGTGSVAVESKHLNGVLHELVESVHLVGESAHLHALEEDKNSVQLVLLAKTMVLVRWSSANLFLSGRTLGPKQSVTQDGAVGVAGGLPAHLDRGGGQSHEPEGLRPAGNLDWRHAQKAELAPAPAPRLLLCLLAQQH